MTTAVVLTELPGISVSMECVVEGSDFDPYRHTVEWRKKQLQSDSSGEQVATLASLKGAFAASGRFAVTTDSRTSPTARESFTLTITGNHEFTLTITGNHEFTLTVTGNHEFTLTISQF